MSELEPEKPKNSLFLGLGKDIVIYGVFEGVSQLTGLLLLPVFTRVFSTDEYGMIEIIVVLRNFIVSFVSLYLPASIVRYFYEKEAGLDRKIFVSTLMAFVSFFSVIILVMGFIFAKPFSQLLLKNSDYSNFIILGFISAIFVAMASLPKAVLRMERRIIHYNLLNILYSFTYAGFSLYFVFVREIGLLGVFLGYTFAALVNFLAAVAFIWMYFTIEWSKSDLARSLRFSLPLLPSILSNWMNDQADRYVLLNYLGLNAVGIFGAATRIGMAVQLPTGIFSSAWQPYSMTQIKSPKEERDYFYRRALRYYAAGFACVGLMLTAIAPEIFRIMVAEDYYIGFVVMPWIAGSMIFRVSNNIGGIGVVLSERTITKSMLAITGGILNLSLALLFIPKFGIFGAAIGSFIAEFIIANAYVYFSRRFADIIFDYKLLGYVVIFYILTSLSLLWATSQIDEMFLSMAIRFGLLIAGILFILWQTIDQQARKDIRSAQRAIISKLRNPKDTA